MCAVLTLVAVAVFSALPASEIDAEILKSRQQIRNGRLTAEIAGADGPHEYTIKCEIWFDGPNLRYDQFVQGSAGPVTNKLCIRGREYIWLKNEAPKEGGAYVVFVRDIPDESVRREIPRIPLDPRLLGLVPKGIEMATRYYRPTDLIKGGKVAGAVVTDESDGVSVEYMDVGGVRRKYWVSPERSYSVTRIQQQFGPEDSRILDSAESTLEKFSAGNVWFPRTVRYERKEGGKVTRWENCSVVEAEFNTSISPTVFTLAGMNPPKGKTVVRTSGQEAEIGTWDGEKVVPRSVRQGQAIDVPNQPGMLRRSILIATAIVCLMLGAMVLRKRIKGQSSR